MRSYMDGDIEAAEYFRQIEECYREYTPAQIRYMRYQRWLQRKQYRNRKRKA